MGKLKRERQKLHISSAHTADNTSKTVGESNATGTYVLKHPLPLADPPENIFSGVGISFENLKQSLKDEDIRSVISSNKRDFKQKHRTKKERRSIRHETFISKINVIQQIKKDEKARKKRQKTVITGDMKPLADALPSLDLLTDNKEKRDLRKEKKKRSILTAKQRQKHMLHDISVFRKVMADPCYKSDPTGAISNYIQEKIRQGISDNS